MSRPRLRRVSPRKATGTAPVLRRLARAHREGKVLLLLFDYDGTLAPLAAHPSKAVVPAATRTALTRLAAAPAVVLGVLSGRTMEDIENRFDRPTDLPLGGIRLPYLAGTSGLEMKVDGRRMMAPGAASAHPLIEQVRGAMQEVAAGSAGAWVESKMLGVSLHWRDVSPKEIPSLIARARASVKRFGNSVTLTLGPSVLEANAALGWNKGTAVRRIVRDVAPRGCEVLYAGDSSHDHDAFRAVVAAGGIAIGVGRHAPPGAALRLRSPQAVGAFLTRLAAAIDLEGS